MKKKYTYPVITEENFEEMMSKLLVRRKNTHTFNGSPRQDKYDALKIRVPKTRNDFYKMTKALTGEGLKIERLTSSFVEFEPPKTEKGKKLWEMYSMGSSAKIKGKYVSDLWRVIGQTAFGNMGTGGKDYGEVSTGYRGKKRIQTMLNSTLRIRSSESLNQT